MAALRKEPYLFVQLKWTIPAAMPERLPTLKRALSLTGDKRALCKALWTSLEELDEYLRGEKTIPESIYLAALKIVEKAENLPRK